jgi:hypothetical protein
MAGACEPCCHTARSRAFREYWPKTSGIHPRCREATLAKGVDRSTSSEEAIALLAAPLIKASLARWCGKLSIVHSYAATLVRMSPIRGAARSRIMTLARRYPGMGVRPAYR